MLSWNIIKKFYQIPNWLLMAFLQKVARWNHQLLAKHFLASNHPVEIVKCIKDAISNYQTAYSLKDKSRIHIDLHEATISGDENIIQYIMFELLANAEYAIEAIGSDENIPVVISSSKDNNNYHIKIKNKCLPINSSDVKIL